MNRSNSRLLRAIACALFLALAAGGAAAADKSSAPAKSPAAKAVAGKTTPRTARIGGGQIVPLAPSKYTSAELAGMRPHYEALKPKLNNP